MLEFTEEVESDGRCKKTGLQGITSSPPTEPRPNQMEPASAFHVLQAAPLKAAIQFGVGIALFHSEAIRPGAECSRSRM